MGIGRYGQHLVKVDTTMIDQITSAGLSPNNDIRLMAPLDKIEPTAVAKMGGAPVIM